AFRSRRKGCRCKSCHADHFGMSTGQADRASVLTSACLRASGALRFAKRTSRLGKLTCKTWEVHSTAFRHCLVDGRWLSVERQTITQLDFFRVHQLSTLITQLFRKRA